MLFDPFTFPNGQTAKNRFFKSAMEEQLAQSDKPTQNLVNLYRTWAQGRAGVLVTGNVMINPQGKGSAGDVVVSDERDLPMLKAWAAAGKTDGTLMIMQINHAGKQSPKALNPVPVAPSAVPLVDGRLYQSAPSLTSGRNSTNYCRICPHCPNRRTSRI